MGKQLLIIVSLLAAVAGGCGPAAKVNLVQPQLTGPQSDLQLVSDNAHWAKADEVTRVLAEFPLPGARTGTPTYLLYLRMPADEKLTRVNADPGQPQVRGFIIQTRGEYAGLTRLTAGAVEMRKPSPLSGNTRKVAIDATCEDGTRITGTIKVDRDDFVVSRFETRRRPADVQNLIDDPSPEPPPAP